MSSTPPPIQPPENHCPRCGAFIPAEQSYCANCGYGMPTGKRSGSNAAQVVWIVLFILIGLPAGCVGGCFVVLLGNAPSSSQDLPIWLLALAGVGVFVGLLTLMILSFRKKK